MVIGVVSGYDEIAQIERCLVSLRRSVDYIVYVDGAYADFPHKSPVSDDGTLVVARDIADIVIETKRSWRDEIHKRNAYLVGSPGDWYVHIDADETLEGELDRRELEQGDDLDMLLERTVDATPPYWVYRIFRHRRGLHYFGTHHALWVGETLLNKLVHPKVESVKIRHDILCRSAERLEAKAVYYRRLALAEREFRDVHGL